MTISAQAFSQERTACEELAALSDMESIEVDLSHAIAAPCPSAGRISMSHLQDDHWEMRTSRLESRTYGMMLQPSFFELISSDIQSRDSCGAAEARQTALDAEAHDYLKNDLLVTTSDYLLSRRFSTRGWPGTVGVVTPNEASGLTSAFLRSRGEFVMLDSPTMRTTLGPTLFYAAVARTMMPTATAALRYCLSPSERGRLRPVADHLLGIFDRVHDLAVAADHLGVLGQIEGHLGGGNDLLAQQLYHLQNSLVLFTGSLDVMAWVIASLDGQVPRRMEVGWRSLRRKDGWRRACLDPHAVALLEEARRDSEEDELIALAIALRDTYQHRHPVVGGICEFHNPEGLAEACLAIVDLGASVGAAPNGRSHTTGVLPTADLDVVFPASFQQGLLRTLTHTVERVLGATAWPEDDWWEPAPGRELIGSKAEAELWRAFRV